MSDRAASWFERRTFHHSRFADLKALSDAKERQGLTISVCIPARNERATIGPIIRTIRRRLIHHVALVDEIVVVDATSEDGTPEIAERAGATVVEDRAILPSLEPSSGKGEALWKSLFVLKGDLIVWVDADIENFHHRFIYGPLGPLLTDEDIGYVKAFYERPLRRGGQLLPAEGGRVTELLARPLISVFWPELSGIAQPLAGEYAGRRRVLEQVPFFTHYGVELGLILDIADRFGLDTMAQVDLERRVHRNRPIGELAPMAAAILQVALRRLEARGKIALHTKIEETLYRFGTDGRRLRSVVHVDERPPAASLPEYRTR